MHLQLQDIAISSSTQYEIKINSITALFARTYCSLLPLLYIKAVAL